MLKLPKLRDLASLNMHGVKNGTLYFINNLLEKSYGERKPYFHYFNLYFANYNIHYPLFLLSILFYYVYHPQRKLVQISLRGASGTYNNIIL